MNTKITKLPKSEVEIEGELDAEIFESYFKKALKKIGENVELDGFRPGKVPEAVLLSKVPEIKILEEMAQMALAEHYPKIIETEKLDVINRPEINITKLARHNPLGFKIKTTLMPEVAIADYKKIAKEIKKELEKTEKEIEVTEEEIENTITDIRKSRAPKMHISEPLNASAEASGDPAAQDLAELPELNDEFVQAMGPFENVADFKEKLKANLKLEKENLKKEKKRIKMIEKIIEDSTIDTPQILIDLELDKILYRMESDITQMGIKFEDYLKHLNKTIDELRIEFAGDAEKKAKLGLVLNKISELENIVADEEEIAKEVEHILEHYKEADPERARMHSQNILTNEKIFQFLESQE
jgi:trigger factor